VALAGEMAAAKGFSMKKQGRSQNVKCRERVCACCVRGCRVVVAELSTW